MFVGDGSKEELNIICPTYPFVNLSLTVIIKKRQAMCA
jgi:hypothetical protein